MKYRDWLFIAFILTALVGAAAMWAADRQIKGQAAANSIHGIADAMAGQWG